MGLNAILYANRAQIHLRLQYYGKCIADAKASIACNVDCYKAYARAASAAKALSKYNEANRFCHDGLLRLDKLMRDEKTNKNSEKELDHSSDSSSDNFERPRKVKTDLQKMEQTMEKLIDLQKVCRLKQAQIEKKKLQKQNEKLKNEKQRNLLHRTLKERQITIGC